MLDFESDIENFYGKYLVIERHTLQIQDTFAIFKVLLADISLANFQYHFQNLA